jgi:hypothetical protein
MVPPDYLQKSALICRIRRINLCAHHYTMKIKFAQYNLGGGIF